MAEYVSNTVYFSKSGKENTERTLELANECARKWDISTIVVATTTGYTGRLAVEKFKDLDVVAVTHATGYKEPNIQELTDSDRSVIEESGGKILTVQHAFGGVNRAIRNKTGTYFPDEVIADVLRTFGAGMKVMFEIAMMAADAGLVEVGKPALAIAGTHRGADSAAILIPVNTFEMFKIQLLELICIPSMKHPAFS